MSQTIVTPPLTHTLRRSMARMWEEPETRSMIIGVVGTILVHLLLLLVAPKVLRTDPAHTLARPHAKPQQFSIQLAPETFKAPPKPKQPMKYVDINPNAPENTPDKTNNFASRNQQVAQEKPTPDGKNDRPAMEGQKEFHSTQIVDGQLQKTVEQTPVPPAPTTPATESKLTAPKAEQNPLTGFEKKLGTDASAFGTNIAEPSDAARNIPQKIAGQKNVPLIEGATDAQPVIDPRHPRARPQVVKTIQTRPAIFEENKIGTANVGIIGVSAQFSQYGLYLQKMNDIVQIEWDSILDESRISPGSGSTVIVTFIMNSEGKITKIVKVENKANEQGARACVSAITNRAPYGPWTDDMKAMLGEEQELTFFFLYR